jgi:hypothetical protein
LKPAFIHRSSGLWRFEALGKVIPRLDLSGCGTTLGRAKNSGQQPPDFRENSLRKLFNGLLLLNFNISQHS